MRPVVTLTRPLVIVFVALFASAQSGASQQTEEPVVDQVREVFKQPGMNLGFLFQSVLDPGIDGERARARVTNARLIASGALDGGFGYFLQTNFAASPSLLDASVYWSVDPRFEIRAGRLKTPFSQELLTPAGGLDFVGRSRVVNGLSANRQFGAQLSGDIGPQLSWAFGGFTSGSNATPNESLAAVGQLSVADITIGDGVLRLAWHGAVGQDGAVGAGQQGTGFVGDGRLVGAEGHYEVGRLLLAAEIIRGDWEPTVGPDMDADGLYVTGGWMVRPEHQALLRWDRYRAPGAQGDDVLILGYTGRPTSVAKIQVNWRVPVDASATPHALLVNFQIWI